MDEVQKLPFKNGHIDGITILNLEGEILFSAKFNAKLSNLDESQQLVGKRFLEVYKNLTPETSTLYRAMQTGGPIYQERQYLKRLGKDGIYITSFSLPILSGNQIVGAIDLSCQEQDGADESEARFPIALNADSLRSDRTRTLMREPRAAYEYDDIIAVNETMKHAKEYIKVVAACDLPVMLCGEIGTGKEMFAHAIHNESQRRDKPFFTQNCSAIPETLLEHALFGTLRSGETTESSGILELADGGTVFLDEIDSMPLHLQYKLLRVLQLGHFSPCGSAVYKKLNVKIITSLSRNPEEGIASGTLRQDLYYRLSTLSIALPPLRERREDIRYFVEAYVKKYNGNFHTCIRYISNKLIEKLQECSWPGNTGELEQVIVYGLSIADAKSETLHFSDIEARYNSLSKLPSQVASSLSPQESDSLASAVSGYERELIQKTFSSVDGNITAAAKLLNIPRQTLQRKVKQYGIRREET